MVGDRHVEQGGFCNEPEFSLSTVCEYRTVASAWSLGERAKEESVRPDTLVVDCACAKHDYHQDRKDRWPNMKWNYNWREQVETK